MIEGADFRLDVRSAGKKYLALEIGGAERLAVGRVRCGKFSEIGALAEKFRVHRGNDRLVCGVESTATVPFGCEYEIARDLQCADGALAFSTDIAARHFGRVGDVGLETLFFSGKIERAALLLYGEEKAREFTVFSPGILWEGEICPLRLRVDFCDGVAVEYQTGFDLWRHAAARKLDGVHAHYALFADENGVRLERDTLCYDENVEAEKRPWRFNQLIAWKSPHRAGCDAASAPQTIPGCPLSGAWRREFRRRIRRSAENFVLGGATTQICLDPAHLDRAGRGELPHYPPEEYFSSYVWANRLLKQSGHFFTLAPGDGKNLLFDVLSFPPREFLPESGENA